jgi:DNA-binding transcriptional LysR family regulator
VDNRFSMEISSHGWDDRAIVTPDLNAMAVFAKVAELGSFVGAAVALSMPTSTVSRRVAELEASLGTRLLHRTTRRVRLTEDGAAFYSRCARVVAEARYAVDELVAHQEDPQGRLRVSTPPLFAQLVLGDVAAIALRRWPRLELEIVASETRVSLLDDGFDLAIRVGSLADSSLTARKIGDARRIVCASPGYVAEHGLPAQPAELGHHRCILVRPGSTWHFVGPEGRVEAPVGGRLAVNDILGARRAALAGVGLAYLPTVACLEDLERGRLVAALGEWTRRAAAAIWAVHAGGALVPPKVRAFVELLVEQFAAVSDGSLRASRA